MTMWQGACYSGFYSYLCIAFERDRCIAGGLSLDGSRVVVTQILGRCDDINPLSAFKLDSYKCKY